MALLVPVSKPSDDRYLAAGIANMKEVRKLLNEGVNPNAAVGCKDRDTDSVKVLLSKWANVNARAGQMGITALMNAAAFGIVPGFSSTRDRCKYKRLLNGTGNAIGCSNTLANCSMTLTVPTAVTATFVLNTEM